MGNKSICMITHDSPYIDRRILLEAKSLAENGYDVSIIYPYGAADDDFQHPGIRYIPAAQEGKKNIKSTLSKFKKNVRRIAPVRLHRFLKRIYFSMQGSDLIEYQTELLGAAICERYDIYVAHDLPALPIAHEAAVHHESKLVYDAHEFYTGQGTIPLSRIKFLESLEKKLLPHVDLMFTVNEDIAELYREYHPIKQIEVLYNATENLSGKESHDLHRLLDLSEAIKIVIYQGGFIERRNLEVLVASARFLPDHIVLVMLGYGYLEEKLKASAAKAGTLGKKIFFMDRVPQKELIAYTAGADYGIIPYPDIDLNTRFCTPNKFFEFLTAGLPMIANKKLVTVGHLIDTYKLGGGISFDSAHTVAEGITSAIDAMDVNILRRNAQEALNHFSWNAQARNMLDAYQKLR